MKLRPSKPNGYVVFRGPSLYDGKPIVVILTGLHSASTNRKTGGMLQTYILPAGIDPVSAWKKGRDVSVCGGCPHRSPASGGKGTCYVTKMHGPASVFKAWKRGAYPVADVSEVSELVRGRKLRIGTWGDPAAVPAEVWAQLASGASARTGYTHGWRQVPALRGLVMASVDSVAELLEARSEGWATFRVAPLGESGRLPGEVICPASAEAGKKTTCENCPVKCTGEVRPKFSGRVIQDHGPRKAMALLSA